MRETIASTWVYQLVIVFILIFVAFLVLSITYTKNYKNKNEMINIIEKYEGVNDDSVKIINNYLVYNNYKAKGKCKVGDGWIGSTDLSSNVLENVVEGTKYYYCIKKKFSANEGNGPDKPTKKTTKSKMYYQIKTFFKFNLPILGDFATFSIDGTTNDIFNGEDIFDRMNNESGEN